MMKVLVIDDDGTQRLFLKRFLQKKLGYTVFEAINGLEGLSIMQEEKPDLILLDVMMPVMDGREFLEVVRQDHSYDSIPVVVLSAANEKSLVARLIKLGVTDYLTKPISSTAARRRLESIMKRNKSDDRQSENPAIQDHGNKREKLLLIHQDAKFREWFKSFFSKRFDIIEEKNGIDGLKKYFEEQPMLICIGEGLKLLNEEILAKKVKANNNNKTGIYLITEKELHQSDCEHFDGFIKQSYKNSELLRSFSKTVFNEINILFTVFDIASDQISETLIKLAKQTIDVLSGEKICVVQEERYQFPPDDVRVVAELFEKDSRDSILIALFGSGNDVLSIAEKILDRSCTLNKDAEEAFGDVLRTICGGVKNLLERYGIDFEESPLRVNINPYNREEIKWNIAVPFRFNENEFIGMGVVVKRNAT